MGLLLQTEMERICLDRGSNYSSPPADYKEKSFYHDPFTPGRSIGTWSMLWEEGITDEYWEATDAIVETINLSVNTRAAVAISANMVGKIPFQKEFIWRRRTYCRDYFRQAYTRSSCGNKCTVLYKWHVEANSVLVQSLVIATGMGPNWRVGEGLSWARPVRGRRAFMANINLAS